MKSYKRCIWNREGFTLIEVLVAMLVISISISMLVPIVRVMNSLSDTQYESEDYLAIAQVRLVLAQSYSIELIDQELHFRYHLEDAYLTFHNQRFVKRPGYEIFLQDVEDAYMQRKGECYELTWIRKNKAHSAILVCE